jgi:hypothetical protein
MKQARTVDPGQATASKFQAAVFTLCVAKRTRPNDPVPSVTPTSKSAKLMGVGKVRTSDMFYKNWIDRLRSDDISVSDSGANSILQARKSDKINYPTKGYTSQCVTSSDVLQQGEDLLDHLDVPGKRSKLWRGKRSQKRNCPSSTYCQNCTYSICRVVLLHLPIYKDLYMRSLWYRIVYTGVI